MGGWGFCKGWHKSPQPSGRRRGFSGAPPASQVLKQLQSKYGELYRQDNVILSGTHTHSGPGGYFQYTLFWITSKGLVRPALSSIVSGIVKVSVTQPSVWAPRTALAAVFGVAPPRGTRLEVGLCLPVTAAQTAGALDPSFRDSRGCFKNVTTVFQDFSWVKKKSQTDKQAPPNSRKGLGMDREGKKGFF